MVTGIPSGIKSASSWRSSSGERFRFRSGVACRRSSERQCCAAVNRDEARGDRRRSVDVRLRDDDRVSKTIEEALTPRQSRGGSSRRSCLGWPSTRSGVRDAISRAATYGTEATDGTYGTAPESSCTGAIGLFHSTRKMIFTERRHPRRRFVRAILCPPRDGDAMIQLNPRLSVVGCRLSGCWG